jgi:hypothetical protein
MLGYTREEVEAMLNAIVFAYRRRVVEDRHAEHLNKAADLLEGLLAEGHVS